MRATVFIFIILFIPSILFSQDLDEEEMPSPSEKNVDILSEGISGIAPSDLLLLKTIFNSNSVIAPDKSGVFRLKPGAYALPYASSSLPEDKYGFYGAKNLDDGNIETAWSEGKKGSGIGERIAIAADHSFTAVIVNNGWRKDQKGWENNNRVKKARIGIYAYSIESADTIIVGKNKAEYVVVFEDENDDAYWQVWSGVTGISQAELTNYLFVLEIQEVYRGKKYDDTCIAEISLTIMQ
jgi:hypothetical protein